MNGCARFLVLLGDASRALLFDRGRQLLGEVIEDDGFIVESLLRSAKECPLAAGSLLLGVRSPAMLQQPLRCFALR